MEKTRNKSDWETPDIIYIQDQPLVLTDNARHYRTQHPEAANYLLLAEADPNHFRTAITHLENTPNQGVILEYKDLLQIQKNLTKSFPEIKAAGGLVREPGGKVLMIHRNGKWDLPKGKVDKGETLESAAVREIREETGLPEVNLLYPLCQSQHIYCYRDQHVLKTTYWFAMEAQEAYQLVPQEEEGITIAEWADAESMKIHLQNTFETIKSVFRNAGELLV